MDDSPLRIRGAMTRTHQSAPSLAGRESNIVLPSSFKTIQGADPVSRSTGRGLRVFVLLIAAILLMQGSARADGEFEPNDEPNAASGPIFSGSTISATLETTNDQDFYFFYLPAQTQLRFTLSNTGTKNAYICSSIIRQDNSGPVEVYGGALDDVDRGETQSGAVTLERGKYYFKVDGCFISVAGEAYTFRLDPPGVTSTYEPFATECANAHPPVDQASAALAKARAKLAKAKSHHNVDKVRGLRARVQARKSDYKAAIRAETAACSVPQ